MHYGKSYFDNRVRIHIDGKLHNFHILTIPMFNQHTADNIFRLVSRFLDVCHELGAGHRLRAGLERSECVEARGSGEDKVSVEPTGWKLS